MQFKNPEILYALFLLLIPIFIHLFRLRRFQKVAFTNVAFLKEVIIQTRKSSQIKKWLTLLIRIFALTALIFAFANPFFESDKISDDQADTVIYLDNSFSQQAKGAKGTLLESATQELYGSLPENQQINWFTNDAEYRNVSTSDFQSQILKTDFSPNTLTPKEVLFRAEKLFSSGKSRKKQLIYLSDFSGDDDFPEIPGNIQVDVVRLKPQILSNIAVDTAYILSKSGNNVKLNVRISKQGDGPEDVSVSIFDGDNLINKGTVSFGENISKEIEFDLNAADGIQGKIVVPDPGITFDNEFYFTINKTAPITVLSINNAPSDFLKRIFDDEKFQFTESALNTLNYSEIPNQNFIILNELEEIPGALIAALNAYVENGGSLSIIPGVNVDVSSYNKLLASHRLGSLAAQQQGEKKITRIIFSNPLYADVFEKEVQNFQYPSVSSYFNLATGAAPVLSYEDNKPFLVQREKTYLFSAALSGKNSNFTNSPLVVPTIYNMGLQSLPLPEISYVIGQQNQIAIPITLSNNEILKMSDENSEFIPSQQVKASHVLITTDEEPNRAGIYSVIHQSETVKNLSFNINRAEGKLNYTDPNRWNGVEVHQNIGSLFSEVYDLDSGSGLWKWFVIFALIFFLSEMLILKFMK